MDISKHLSHIFLFLIAFCSLLFPVSAIAIDPNESSENQMVISDHDRVYGFTKYKWQIDVEGKIYTCIDGRFESDLCTRSYDENLNPISGTPGTHLKEYLRETTGINNFKIVRTQITDSEKLFVFIKFTVGKQTANSIIQCRY